MYPIAATLVAMMFSATPGLNSSSLMALVIPMPSASDSLPVMLVFGALVGGATFMGSVTAILFNIPGKASNAVTLLDGYPMTQQGQAKTAIGCAAASSALGSTLGIAVLIGLLPIMRQAAVALGPAEYLMLAIWGLTTLAALTGNSLVKGLIAAGLGLQLAFIGHDPRTAEPRFTFGIDYLQDGLSLVPVLLGLFALAEVIDLMVSGRETLSGQRRLQDLTGSVTEGVRSVFRHFGLLVRSSVIGVLVGAIPGIGGSVAGFVAYGHASQTARDRSRCRQGRHPWCAGARSRRRRQGRRRAGADAGARHPGRYRDGDAARRADVARAQSGRELLSNNLVLVFVLIWSLFLSNWLTSLLGLSLVTPMARLSTLRTSRLVPVILHARNAGRRRSTAASLRTPSARWPSGSSAS